MMKVLPMKDKEKKFDLNLSPSLANIIEKLDKRVKYLCDTEEKLINIHNLLKIRLDKIELDEEYDIKFNLRVNLLETNKVTALYYINKNKRKNIREKNQIIEECEDYLKKYNN